MNKEPKIENINIHRSLIKKLPTIGGMTYVEWQFSHFFCLSATIKGKIYQTNPIQINPEMLKTVYKSGLQCILSEHKFQSKIN